jgi:hypothetical protein
MPGDGFRNRQDDGASDLPARLLIVRPFSSSDQPSSSHGRRHHTRRTTTCHWPCATSPSAAPTPSASPKSGRLPPGYTQRRDSAEEVLLAPDDWSFPRLDFQHSPTPTSGPGRVHLDLTAADMAAEVDRLIDLGATELWTIDTAQSGTTTWTTMADPDGNQFCVVQQPPGD